MTSSAKAGSGIDGPRFAHEERCYAGGRLVIISSQGGVKAEINIGKLLPKRGHVFAMSLRSLHMAERAVVVEQVRTHVWPLVEKGVIKPVIHAKMPPEDATEAHRNLAESQHIGKILLTH